MNIHHLQKNLPCTFEHHECSFNAHACGTLDKVSVVLLLWKAVFVILKENQHPRTTWVRCITNRSVRMELANHAVLVDCSPSPQVGIVHRTRPTYVEIPKQTFGRHHALQKDWMESFAVVLIWSIQSGCNDGYVGAIRCPNDVGNLVQVLELLCISIHIGRRGPIDEFL